MKAKDLRDGTQYLYTGGAYYLPVTYKGVGRQGHMFTYCSVTGGRSTMGLGPYEVIKFIERL